MNFKTTAILLALLLVIGGYLFFTREKEEGGAKPKEEHKLLDIARSSDVTKVSITAADGKKTVLQKVGKDWRLVEPVDALADDADVNGMIENLISMKSNNRLDPKEATPDKTGLAKPQYTVDLTSTGGKTSQVQFGDKLAVGDGVYAKVDGKAEVEVVPVNALEKVDRPASAFRQLKLIETPSLEIKTLAVSGKVGDQDVNFKLQKEANDWQMIAPAKMEADSAAVTDLLNALTGLRAVSFVDRTADASSAMETPMLTITFGTQPPSTQPVPATTQASGKAPVTVTFGDFDLLKKHVFVKLSDSPFVAKVPASSVDAFKKQPYELRDKRVVDVKPEEVSRVTIETVPAATTQASATKPASTEVVLERRKQTAAGAVPVPFVTGSPATQPSTKPTLTLENVLPKHSAWVLASAEHADADDSDVNALLGALHPLRVDKYLEKNPTTQPAKSYVLSVHTEAAGGAGAADHKLRFIDRGESQAYVGEYNGLTFEVSRFTLSRYLEGDFKKKPAGAAPAGGGAPAPGIGFPGQ